MVINAEAREEDESYRSPVDLLFDDLERVDEDHIAVKNWKVFKQAGPETNCQGLFYKIKSFRQPCFLAIESLCFICTYILSYYNTQVMATAII